MFCNCDVIWFLGWGILLVVLLLVFGSWFWWMFWCYWSWLLGFMLVLWCLRVCSVGCVGWWLVVCFVWCGWLFRLVIGGWWVWFFWFWLSCVCLLWWLLCGWWLRYMVCFMRVFRGFRGGGVVVDCVLGIVGCWCFWIGWLVWLVVCWFWVVVRICWVMVGCFCVCGLGGLLWWIWLGG